MNYPKNRNSRSRRKSYVGEKIGYLNVLKYIERNEDGKEIREYECFCEACKSTRIMSHNSLKIAKSHMVAEGKCPSCGCLKSFGVKMVNKKNERDLSGQVFGYLTVIEKGPVILVGSRNKRRLTWKCKCVCGSIIFVATGDLTSGNTKSCGCALSSAEAMIANILSENRIAFYREYSFEDLLTERGNPLRFDFAIVDADQNLICLIEYQGQQHYKDYGWFGQLQREETDEKKKTYCDQNNIKLFEIPYDKDIKQEMQNIIQYVHDNTVPNCALAQEV